MIFWNNSEKSDKYENNTNMEHLIWKLQPIAIYVNCCGIFLYNT
jgi:hypothetical protein